MSRLATLDGFYYDPKHGNCLRRVETLKKDEEYRIRGVYGDDEPHTGSPWSAVMEKAHDDTSATFRVDFAGKAEREERFATAWPCASQNGKLGPDICWSDGNRWLRLYNHPTQL